jgi:hypothetical protein
MQISSLGEHLNFVIGCDYTILDNWRTFLTWFSIQKNLPEANVSILCNRLQMQHSLFLWTKRCQVPFYLHKAVDDDKQYELILQDRPCLYLKPFYVCLRDFEEVGLSPNFIVEERISKLDERFYSDVKSNEMKLFVSYFQGWGNFAMTKWINTDRCPLKNNVDFTQVGMTANESRLGHLWKEASRLYQAVSRS